MRIETEIKELFTAKKTGAEMVRFTATKGGGQLWAAPLKLVRDRFGKEQVAPGQRLEIEVTDDRIVAVRPLAGSHAAVSSGVSAMKCTIPYGFVPIEAGATVADKPILHDGSGDGESGGGDLLSGEIRCSLTTLTPLLAGNARYPVEEADKDKFIEWGLLELLEKKTKQIAEPLRLSDGRVVIAGSALKGMVRHSLSALLSAPMERVAERHFTYRPNLKPSDASDKYVVRPAVIKASNDGGWDVEVFPGARDALFVRSDAEHAIRKASSKGPLGIVHGIRKDDQRIVRHDAGQANLTGYRVTEYKGGIDGHGLLADAFVPRTRTYKMALAPIAGQTLHIPSSLYQRYLNDQKDLLANDQTGHLTAHPLQFNANAVKAAICNSADLAVNQLIYVELTTDAKGKVSSSSRVTSFGHHFRYRWAYTSSVRKNDGKPRDCITPRASEQQADADGKPHALTAARLLFGYVREDEKNPVGKGAFERLAGRIAINHAVSEENPRFLGNAANGYCVPLPILGQPKLSAWEFYLRQDLKNNMRPATYGDLPGDPGGDLAGRKYYRHQPYEQAIRNIERGNGRDEKGKPLIESDHATLARFICEKGTRFGFAIRFARIREWELGALIAVLEPQRYGDQAKTYAHKLGHGRPLGMGSVTIAIDDMRVRKESEAVLPQQDNRAGHERAAIDALQKTLPAAPTDWLKMHEYSTKTVAQVAYPTAKTTIRVDGEKKDIDAIYAWHTELRGEYSKRRREKKPDWSALYEKIQKAKGGEC